MFYHQLSAFAKRYKIVIRADYAAVVVSWKKATFSKLTRRDFTLMENIFGALLDPILMLKLIESSKPLGGLFQKAQTRLLMHRNLMKDKIFFFNILFAPRKLQLSWWVFGLMLKFSMKSSNCIAHILSLRRMEAQFLTTDDDDDQDDCPKDLSHNIITIPSRLSLKNVSQKKPSLCHKSHTGHNYCSWNCHIQTIFADKKAKQFV